MRYPTAWSIDLKPSRVVVGLCRGFLLLLSVFFDPFSWKGRKRVRWVRPWTLLRFRNRIFSLQVGDPNRLPSLVWLIKSRIFFRVKVFRFSKSLFDSSSDVEARLKRSWDGSLYCDFLNIQNLILSTIQ